MFLYGSEKLWNKEQDIIETDLEKKHQKIVLLSSNIQDIHLQEINHRNSFPRLQRIIAYTQRFINIRVRRQQHSGPFTAEELNKAVLTIVRKIQKQEFCDDYQHLEKEGSVSSQSSLLSLCPFLDENGVIRVGGRRDRADIAYDAKHPMLLPYAHSITRMIFTYMHNSNLHAGPQTLLALVRQRFWPIKGKTLARSVVQNCVRCCRSKPQFLSQLMGQLPASRTQPSRPFMNSGVDFCGPFYVHSKGRGSRTVKAYVSIFCCFST